MVFKKNHIARTFGRTTIKTLATLAILSACTSEFDNTGSPSALRQDIVKVTGEIESAKSAFFGPPAVPNIWQYTISFMAPEGREVTAGTPILRFNPQELETRLRDKNNKLNEKQKQLEKQQIVAREAIAEIKLTQQEAIADFQKAQLKADIPVELLASRDYKENKLLLKQSELTLAFKEQELQKEQRVQDTEINILEREIAVLEGEVSQFNASVESMTVKAAGPGVVVYTVDHRNNKHEVGDQVWMGRRVMELPDLSQLQVHLEIPERESARIAVGQAVKFVVDAVPDQQFHGEIIELASVIHTKSRSQPARVFDATVSMRNPDISVMRPGMSVSAEIGLSAAVGAVP
ncbi:MAG: HlyD family efflux transporter periplasmic adaptor subunit [Gammaproteobacteria bacterium]|nr:HlyD family efflux transporter periplasmic adaptor subunit [Gammaproteobacteria bacterium]